MWQNKSNLQNVHNSWDISTRRGTQVRTVQTHPPHGWCVTRYVKIVIDLQRPLRGSPNSQLTSHGAGWSVVSFQMINCTGYPIPLRTYSISHVIYARAGDRPSRGAKSSAFRLFSSSVRGRYSISAVPIPQLTPCTFIKRGVACGLLLLLIVVYPRWARVLLVRWCAVTDRLLVTVKRRNSVPPNCVFTGNRISTQRTNCSIFILIVALKSDVIIS